MNRHSAGGPALLGALLTIGATHMTAHAGDNQQVRARDAGIVVGSMPPGDLNSITDVEGVVVGHVTIIEGDSVRTGVTAVLPHDGNLYQQKIPASACVFNAFGKSAGLLQVQELGNIETPIVLTNTLSVGTAVQATVRWTLDQPGNEGAMSVNAVVGETNDGFLNDIRGQHVRAEHVIGAIEGAAPGAVREGGVGAGAGTRAFGFKGGIGTSSRIVETPGPERYTVGVLVQSNFGRSLRMCGVPVSERLQEARGRADGDGSCMIVVATDAPIDTRNLERMAKRSFAGMARTCDVMSNGSGDFAIAFTTAWRVSQSDPSRRVTVPRLIDNRAMTPYFRAVEEATEEAIYNSLLMTTTVTGRDGNTARALPVGETLEILRAAGAIR